MGRPGLISISHERTIPCTGNALLDAIPHRALILDARGAIVAASHAWLEAQDSLGADYLVVLRQLTGLAEGSQKTVEEGIRQALAGKMAEFAFDSACVEANQGKRCRLRCRPIEDPQMRLFLVMHEDITEWENARDRLELGVREREEELRLRDVQQQQLIDYLPNGVIHLASDGALVSVNSHGRKSLHMTEEHLKTLKLSDFAGMVIREDGSLFPVEDFPASRCLATGQPQPSELIGVLSPGGVRQWLLVTAVPAPCPKYPGKLGALATFLDLTERKQIEDALQKAHQELELRVEQRTSELQKTNALLRESEARFRQMAENIGEIVYILQLEPRKMLYISPSYEKVFGLPVEQMYDNWHSFLKVVVPEDLPRVRRSLETRLHEAVDTVYRINPDGQLRWVRSRAFPLRDADGRVYRVTGIVEDISDIQFAQHELSRLQQELLEVTEQERSRIGRDLHDGLGQHLTGIAFLAKSLHQRLASKAEQKTGITEREAAEGATITQLVQSALEQSQALARGLQPVTPVPSGLMSALQELARSTEMVFHIACRFECDPPVRIDQEAVANNLYRIAQEATHNAVKHARPSRVQIKLESSISKIELTIMNDGAGMPAVDPRGPGRGLRIMSYRAGIIGGELSVETRKTQETVVRCIVPVPRIGEIA